MSAATTVTRTWSRNCAYEKIDPMSKPRRIQGANVSFFAFQDIITAVTGILILIVILMVLMLRQPGLVDVPVEMTENRSLEELNALIEEAIVKIKKYAGMDLDTGNETEAGLKEQIEQLQKKLDTGVDPLRLALLQEVESAESELQAAIEGAASLRQQKDAASLALVEIQATVNSKADFVQETTESAQVWLKLRPSDKSPILLELDSDGGVLRDIADPEVKTRIASGSLIERVKQIARAADGAESYFVLFIRPSGIQFLPPLQELLHQEGFDLGYRPLDENTDLKIFSEDVLDFTP